VELENEFPFAGEAAVSESTTGTSLLGLGSALYFCIPPNDKLVEHWDRVEDRLYKIRHCQDIEGVERQLALFAPPIDPAALVQAAAQGLSVSSILADLGSPPPIHRLSHLLQRANELCGEVAGLGQSVLAALEKRDGAALERLRATHESDMLERMTAVRERQVLDAKAGRANLEKARDAAIHRLRHHFELLGDAAAVPAAPTVPADVDGNSPLPADTVIAPATTGADTALVASGETGVKVIAKEKEELDKNLAAKWITAGANAGETLAGVFSLFPQLEGKVTPLGVGAGAWWGGQNLGAATSALAKAAAGVATFYGQEAAQAAAMAAFIRREQDWAHTANVAAREIVQLDKQITSADIQIQVAEKELANHLRQIEHAEEIERFLDERFTREETYQWMLEKLLGIHKQSYTLAYELAKQCELAYRNEVGDENASFIQYGYWDDAKKGLLAGEALQLALRRLESAYLNANRRELELTKSVSLLRVDPRALIELRETGRCVVALPEELFDLDFPGHYFRRIKAVRLSIPCIAGPHTSVSCTLRLLSSAVRVNTSMSGSGAYEHENDEGTWIDDDRFRASQTPVAAIATSTAQSDAGVFDLNFRDERYLPFEYAGAISEWAIELPRDAELRQFDHTTVTDAILQLSYTAREGGGPFRAATVEHVKAFLENAGERPEQPLAQLLSLRSEFPSEWRAFLRPAGEGDEQVLRFTIGEQRLPFLAQGRLVVVARVDLFARSAVDTTYEAVLTTIAHDDEVVESDVFALPPNPIYGALNKATLEATDAGLNLEEMDIAREVALKLRRAGVGDFASLDPEDELRDVYLVLHYRLA
jgi:hypothetical protein